MHLSFTTPRKLPRPRDLEGNVVVLDIAFASEAGSSGFESVTLPFIQGLGPRLRAWVDHHDSAFHGRYADDPRFLLTTKAQHGACPELVTPEVVERAGPIDTIVCHSDFDGLASAAKWMRGGIEPYPGCDADARAVDTRVGEVGPYGQRFDRALRARPRDQGLFGIVVRHLASGFSDPSLWEIVDRAAAELVRMEATTRQLALRYEVVEPGLAVVDASTRPGSFDKTLLLLLGQERARMSMVIDNDTVTFAAPFESGVNFLQILGISGGMPTRVSIARKHLADALTRLGLRASDITRFAARPSANV